MIKSLGPGLDSTDFIRIALGSQHTFIVVQNSNLSKPLVIPWPVLLQQIQAQLNISSTSTIDVRDEGTIIDATAQFLNFVGAGVTVTQNGNGVDITIPGGGGGSAVWGSITGTITNQTDLVNYISTALASYVPNTRTITINGVSYDLSANIAWSVGTVTGVTATAPITSSGGAAPNVSTSMNTNKLIGRGTAGVGVMEEITLGTNLSLSGTTLNATVSGVILKGTASGTDTYTTTISGVTSYNDGDAYLIRFTNGNTTGCTLNINSLGAITLYRNNDGALIGGDIISGAEMLCIYNSTLVAFQVIGTVPNTLLGYVTNDDSVTITKGQVVYAFGGQGDRMTVKLANNTSDATSARTVGVVLSTSIAANQKGFIMMQGLLDGLNILPTANWSDGDPVYLGATAGSITKVKPYAPNHLVYVGIVTTASNGSAGRMYVNIQNGYELDELHNVQAQSPALKDTLWYDNTVSPAQWKTASITTILGYTPLSQSLTNARIFVGNASNIATAVAMSGDATIANTGALTIANNAVTYAKMQAVSTTSRLLGSSSTTTPVQEISIGTGLSLSGTTLSSTATGTVTSVSASVPAPASPALSVNVSNPTTTPAIAITANGTTSQYVRGDGSLAAFPSVLLQSGRFAWMTQVFQGSAGLINSMEYVASVNKLYVAQGGNNVSIFEATTGELLATISVTAAQRIRYISSINEIWCTSSSVASITRISVSANTLLGTITTSVLANGWEILEYSSTKVFITIVAGGASILVVNPATLAVTATITTNVPAFASGMALNNNPSSAQFDRIVVSSNVGVAILNPNTNSISTTAVNPSSSISLGREIAYSPTDDKYYVASQVNSRIVCLNIVSATTFSVNKIRYNAFQIVSLQIDETNDLILLNQAASDAFNTDVLCNIIQKSTFDSLTNINTPSFGGGNSLSGYIKLDTVNKRAFIAGSASASRSITTVRYL